MQQQGNRLNRLAKSHVIRKACSRSPLGKACHPLIAFLLVVPEGSVQCSRYVGRFVISVTHPAQERQESLIHLSVESAVLTENLCEGTYIIFADCLSLSGLLGSVDDTVKVIYMLLEGLSHPHELVLPNLDIAIDLCIPISLKQFLEAERRARNLDLSLDGEPLHVGADLNLHISRLHDALELKFPSSRPLQHECLLMLIGVL